MKNRILQSLVLLFFVLGANAQQGINYKAIIKDGEGAAIVNTAVTVQFTILESGTTEVYQETHNPTTDANGIVIVNIGEGTVVSGVFNDIDWGSNPHFIKTEINTGSGLTDMGTTEFKTVPYALHSKTTEDVNLKAAVAVLLKISIEGGATPSDLLTAGVGFTDLFNAGVGVGTLRENGISDQDLIDAGLIGTYIDDRDGNSYNWVKIGNQVWMAENLKYLPSVVGTSTSSTTEPYYYVYGYDGTDVNEAKATENYITYGVLYNWTAAMNGASGSSSNPSGEKGVCPTGWHLPSDAEWIDLMNYLGGGGVAGGKLKETGTAHWLSPNAGATNETGFSGLPGGIFTGENRVFAYIKEYGAWWSTTEASLNAIYRSPYYGNTVLAGIIRRTDFGANIRCVRD